MPKTKQDPTARWNYEAGKFLKGKTIKTIRYMTEQEQEDHMWSHRALIIFFTDGSYIYPSADDEGNDAGALFTSDDELPTIPVI